MTEPSLTTLIGDEIQGNYQWWDFVDGEDGFFYGIPYNARRVVKFNPLDKSFTEIGPDLGDRFSDPGTRVTAAQLSYNLCCVEWFCAYTTILASAPAVSLTSLGTI